MKILIAIPCMDTVPVDFAKCLLKLQKPPGTDVSFKQNSLIYDSRNLLSLGAIQQDYSHVLWIDSDMTFAPDALTRLAEDADEQTIDMVTGVYFKRYLPTLPVIYDELAEPTTENNKPVRHIHEFASYPKNSLFTVRGCGFGFCLTSTKLLKHVWDVFGPAFHPFPWAGEDLSFCHRVNELGYPIFCDSNVSCGHVGQFIFSELLFSPSEVSKNEE